MFSRGAFKDMSCGKDVFSVGASKGKSCEKDVALVSLVIAAWRRQERRVTSWDERRSVSRRRTFSFKMAVSRRRERDGTSGGQQNVRVA